MDLNEATKLIRQEMHKNNVGHLDLVIGRGKSLAGSCQFVGSRQMNGDFLYFADSLSFSKHYIAALSWDELRVIVLHEIAHALAGPHAHHNHVWKRYAVSLGIKPERCHSHATPVEHSVIGTCPNGHTTKYHRLPLLVKSCGKCHSQWDFRFIYTYQKNGRELTLAEMPTRYRQEYARFANKYNRKVA